MSIQSLDIHLEREDGVFYAGETIRGAVVIETTRPVRCRGFFVRLQGRARVLWYEGTYTTRNRSAYSGSTVFQCQHHTLLGGYYRTALLDEAGAQANFDAVPNSGIVRIPCEINEIYQEDFQLVVRVMDYDWGKRDDLLGEVLLDVPTLLQSGQKLTYELKRRGRNGLGEITASAKVVESILPPSSGDSSGESAPMFLELTIHNASGLRKGDLLGKNDVYCQVYRVPRDTVLDPHKPLPNPPSAFTVPTGVSVYPFVFELRTDAPGSAELPVSSYARLRYDLYTHLDKALWRQASRKLTISVVANRPVPSRSLLCPISHAMRDEPVRKKVILGCPCRGLQGHVSTNIRLDRRSFAAGEPIDLTASTVELSLPQKKTVTIALVMYVELSNRRGRHITRRRRRNLWTADLPPDTPFHLHQLGLTPESIVMPAVFPSFDGGVPVSVSSRHYACLRWSYTIELSIRISRKEYVRSHVPVLVAATSPFAHVLQEQSCSPWQDLPDLSPFSIFEHALCDDSESDTTPCLTNSENRGFVVQAIGVPEAVSTFEEEEDRWAVGENPSFVPLVHVVALDDAREQCPLPVQQAQVLHSS